jgi:hypothetical protein
MAIAPELTSSADLIAKFVKILVQWITERGMQRMHAPFPEFSRQPTKRRLDGRRARALEFHHD